MKKRTIFLIQIVPILLFVLFITQIILQVNNYSLILFKQIGEPISYLLLSLIFIYEVIFIIISSIVNKKYLRLLYMLLLIPLLLFTGLLYGLSKVHNYHEIEIKEHNEKLSIVSHSFMLSGTSYIYQKNNFFVCKEIGYIAGDNGYRPLSNPDSYTYIVDEYMITFTYYFNNNNPEAKLYLQYNNDSYIVIK